MIDTLILFEFVLIICSALFGSKSICGVQNKIEQAISVCMIAATIICAVLILVLGRL